jgi:hypothetical protein
MRAVPGSRFPEAAGTVLALHHLLVVRTSEPLASSASERRAQICKQKTLTVSRTIAEIWSFLVYL